MSFIERKLSVADAPDVTRVQHLEKPSRARILAATYNEKRGGLRDMAVKKKKKEEKKPRSKRANGSRKGRKRK